MNPKTDVFVVPSNGGVNGLPLTILFVIVEACIPSIRPVRLAYCVEIAKQGGTVFRILFPDKLAKIAKACNQFANVLGMSRYLRRSSSFLD